MDHGVNPADLERRKQVRLRLRPDLAITPQKYEGRTYYVVKDPVSMRYYRFKEQEHFLLQFMDGQHTLDEAQKEYEKRFRPERLKLEDLEHFGQQLLTAGLAQNESPRAGKQLFDRRKKRKRSEFMQAITNILYIKLPIFDPDRLLTWMLRYLWWIFTPLFGIASAIYFLAVIGFVAVHWDKFYESLPSYHQFFAWKNVIYMWIALGVVKVIHEFGHGLSCKAFGGEVHEMGALFLVFSPCLYCNVSDAWTLPSKWKRIIISFAGIYVEFMIGATAVIVWWQAVDPFIKNMALCLIVVCTVSTFIFNANPLMRYDGYYMLADWLEIPNLRDRSNRFLKNLALEYCLGVEVQPEPYMALGRKVLFVSYAIISYFYRWFVTFRILIFMADFLKPYKLEVISQMLALGAAASMIGWPAYRLGQNLHRRGRLPDMKTARVVLSAMALAAVVLAFFLVPLPVSYVRQPAAVQLQEDAATPVLLQESGRLDRLLVRDGQEVQEGARLAEFTNPELDFHLNSRMTERNIRAQEVVTLEEQVGRTTDPRERSTISLRLATKMAEKASLDKEIESLQERKRRLVLTAPRDGRVISPPRIEDVGKFFDHSEPRPFCLVGDNTKLRMIVPLRPADYRLLRSDQKELQARGDDIKVTVRVSGRDSQVWQGKLARLPESDAKEIPAALSQRMNGPIAIKQPPPDRPHAHVPLEQLYLATVEVVGHDGAVAPGTLGRVKMECKWRSAAWWVWRNVNDWFDLGWDIGFN